MLTNRIIKFRAWDNEQSKMYYMRHKHLSRDIFTITNLFYSNDMLNISEVILSKEINPEEISGEKLIKTLKNFELLQFTGLYDSNGREVWEDDVCEFYVCPSIRILERCVFENGQFCLSTYSLEFVTYNYDDSFKVLGNIFENPELLNNNDLLSSSTWQKPGETA